MENLTMAYVVYLGLEGTFKDEDMIARVGAMDKAVKILE